MPIRYKAGSQFSPIHGQKVKESGEIGRTPAPSSMAFSAGANPREPAATVACDTLGTVIGFTPAHALRGVPGGIGGLCRAPRPDAEPIR
jgi:hypothetical protein